MPRPRGASSDHVEGARPGVFVRWLIGCALLVGVVGAAFHFSEERDFLRLAEQVQPAWLAAAVLLQAATYVAQGGIWRLAGRAASCDLSRRTAFELSLAKLFIDQTLPSAGISSSILVTEALTHRRMPSASVKAVVLINIASYHLAYVVALVGALAIIASGSDGNPFVTGAAVIFLLFSTGLSGAVLALAGRGRQRLARKWDRIPGARGALDFLAGADVRLVRSVPLLTRAIGLQVSIIVLDATTMWTLVAALGVKAPATGIFASFMVASLFRTMSLVPGGLGTFEATSVLTLGMAGLDVAVALSATLLFRSLSFWLPMLPGYAWRRAAW